jgi:DNA-binding MarR family transcriptional regulator
VSDLRSDAEKLENGLSTVMRGIHRTVGAHPLSDLPVAQLRLLRALSAGAQTPSMLSEQLSTTVSAVTQLANRLESAKLVEREEDPSDRRLRRLRLSGRGARIMKKRKALRIAGVEQLLQSLTDEERRAVLSAIERLALASPAARRIEPESLVFVAEMEGNYRADKETNR